MQELFLSLSQGKIAYWDSKNAAPIILFIHGNSACKEIFLKQFFSAKIWDIHFNLPHELPPIFDSELLKHFRLIAIDLPGNGHSEMARHPKRTYSYTGIAATIQEFLLTLYQEENNEFFLNPLIMGWSLGGHVAIELINPNHNFHLASISGIILCGTPPLDLTHPDKQNQGFLSNPFLTAMKNSTSFSPLTAQKFFAAAGVNVEQSHYFITNTLQMDERARTFLQTWKNTPEARMINQASTVAKTAIPIAIVVGQDDICIDTNYLEQLYLPSLWQEKIHYFDSMHACFWQQPTVFNRLLLEFATGLFVN